MAKRLSCWLGRHAWSTRVEQGQSYQVCSDCGKTPKPRSGQDAYPAFDDRREKALASPYK